MKIKFKMLITLLCIILICSSCTKKMINSDNSIVSSPVDINVSPTIIVEDNSDVKSDITLAPTYPPMEKNLITKISYEDITVGDMYTVNFKENHGIAIDLNGDDKKERIYVNNDGVYVNDIFYENILGHTLNQYEGYKTWWLLDINKEDDLVELIFVDTQGEIDVWHYTDSFYLIGNFRNYNTDKDIRYANFTDNNSISFEYTAYVLERSLLDLTYYLDPEGLLSIMPGEYEITNDTKLTLLKEIKLFSEKDMNSDFNIAQPQVMSLKMTDGLHWTYVIAEDGTEGWIYTETINDKTIVNEELDKFEYFEGFDTAG